MLTGAGLGALLGVVEGPPGYVVRHRDHAGRSWRVVATVATHAEAVRLIDGRGDWWLSKVPRGRSVPGRLF